MKHTLLALLLVPVFSATAFAAGYSGPNAVKSVTSVAQALEAADDTPVTLEGQIVRRIGKEKYEFQDASGSIEVEIDDDEWPNQTVSETAKVRLTGEVDAGMTGRDIDVDRVELLQ